MNKVVEMPTRQQIQEEAAEWLVRLDRDEEPTVAELAELQAWITQSNRHRAELERLAKHWSELNVLTELAVPIGEPQRREAPGFANRTVRFAGAMAAITVMAIMVSSFWGELSGLRSQQDDGLYATAIGQQRVIPLSDSTEIHLNTNSQVRVIYTEDSRTVRLLQGEVHFDVAKDPDRPFRVAAPNGYVEAIGTEFTVRLNEASVDVTVTEGRVRLMLAQSAMPNSSGSNLPPDMQQSEIDQGASAGQEAGAVLTAGQIAVMPFDSSHQAIVTESVSELELARKTAWQDGMILFRGESLSQVVSEISRYTVLQIDINDPKVGDIRIGGQFPVGETDLMLDYLKDNFGLTVTHTGPNSVTLNSRVDEAT